MDTYRDCLVCGKSFKICNTCRKDIDEMFQWRRVVCCPEHFAYHTPIIQYARQQIDKETARNDLQSAIDRYGEIEFCDNIKNIVAEILKDDSAENISAENANINNEAKKDVVAHKSRKKNK